MKLWHEARGGLHLLEVRAIPGLVTRSHGREDKLREELFKNDIFFIYKLLIIRIRKYLKTICYIVKYCMATLHRAISICNIYIPPSYSLKTKDLENIISQIPKPFILLGDFNAHNHLWGSSNITSRGRLIENFINHHNLSLLNDGSTTYLHPATGTLTNIDLAICDPSHRFFQLEGILLSLR